MSTETPKSELKPCPFCGSPAGKADHRVLPKQMPDGTLYESRSVQCSRIFKGCMGAGPIKGSEAEAIEAWNARATDAELSRVREERDTLAKAFAARQKAEAELAEAKANADSWRVQSDRFESQLLETSNQLAETRKELEKTQQKLQAARVVVGEQNKKLVAACAQFERLWKRYQQVQIQPPNTEAKEEKGGAS